MNHLAELFSQEAFGWAWIWGEIGVFYLLFLVFHNSFGKHGK